jgi:hypothetical protein
MNKTTEALKLAEEYLTRTKTMLTVPSSRVVSVVSAIREALAEQDKQEPVSIPDHIICPFCESDHVPDWLHDLKLDAKAIRESALEEAAKVCDIARSESEEAKNLLDVSEIAGRCVAKGAIHQAEKLSAAIRGLK